MIMEKLEYRPGDQYNAGPCMEMPVTTVEAERWLQVYETSTTLEGAIFDREGNLYFTSTAGYAIHKVDMKTKEHTIIFHEEGIRPAAVKIHKDGRLFACCLMNETIGGILAMDPDGNNQEWIVKGYSVDDLAFDQDGGIYFTDFRGDFKNPIGGVYYITPDFKHIEPFCQNMCQPNGIAFSTDYSVLWVTEFQAQRLHRFDLTTNRAGIPFYFTGMLGPDSCCVDADDNVYVAMPGQGRILIFNYFGSPIGQVVVPGREEGHNLHTTHPMVRPDHNELYIVAQDKAEPTQGSWVFKGPSYAVGNKNMFQFL